MVKIGLAGCVGVIAWVFWRVSWILKARGEAKEYFEPLILSSTKNGLSILKHHARRHRGDEKGMLRVELLAELKRGVCSELLVDKPDFLEAFRPVWRHGDLVGMIADRILTVIGVKSIKKKDTPPSVRGAAAEEFVIEPVMRDIHRHPLVKSRIEVLEDTKQKELVWTYMEN